MTAVWRRFVAAVVAAGVGGLVAGTAAGATLMSREGGRPAAELASPTPSASPSGGPSPSFSPTPAPTSAPTPVPTAAPSPTPAPTSRGGSSCTLSLYAETDPDRDGVSLDIRPVFQGTTVQGGQVLYGCPWHVDSVSVTLLDPSGMPLTVTGNATPQPGRCPTGCTTMGPGQGAIAAKMGAGSFIWTNWCGAKAPATARVEGTLDGVAASTVLAIASPPACVAPGQRSILSPPQG